jgi:hypothetical protein
VVNRREYYDLKVRAGVLCKGDRVLVRKLAFEGKHKLADKWESQAYVVLEQPNVDIPVYKVKREDNIGRVRTMHRNLLLPIGILPLKEPVGRRQPETVPAIHNRRKTRKQLSVHSTSSDSYEDEYMLDIVHRLIDSDSSVHSDSSVPRSALESQEDSESSEVQQEELDEEEFSEDSEEEMELRRSTRVRNRPQRLGWNEAK